MMLKIESTLTGNGIVTKSDCQFQIKTLIYCGVPSIILTMWSKFKLMESEPCGYFNQGNQLVVAVAGQVWTQPVAHPHVFSLSPPQDVLQLRRYSQACGCISRTGD